MRLAALCLSGCLTAGAALAEDGTVRPFFGDKTDRYGHDVLGGNEYDGFGVLVTAENRPPRQLTVTLPPNRVIEDVELRLADLTGDGFPEVVTVESSLSGGGELVIYGGIARGVLEKLAATPPIGRRNRWRAPAGIADFDGDGQLDIAEVVTPHLAGILKIWTLRDGALVEIAEPRAGFSNHKIGQAFITSTVRTCGGVTELVLPDLRWREFVAVRLVAGQLVSTPTNEEAAPGGMGAAASCH